MLVQEESISSSPSTSNKSIRNVRTIRKNKRNTKTVETVASNKNNEDTLRFLYYESGEEEDLNKTFVVTSSRVPDYVPFEMETMLMLADRESSKNIPRNTDVPQQHEEFQTCQRLVETELNDEDMGGRDNDKSFFITESELLNCCIEADQMEISTPTKSLRLVNSILEDFAMSPFTKKSLETSARNLEYSPQFILRQMPEKTYCRRKRQKKDLNRRLEFAESPKSADDKEDDRLSNGSSVISMQEISQKEDEDLLDTTTAPDLSNRLSENLLDLTTFFTQENPEVEPDISINVNRVSNLLEDIECMKQFSNRRHHLHSYNSDEDFMGFARVTDDENETSLPNDVHEDDQMNETLISPQKLQTPDQHDQEMNIYFEDDHEIGSRKQTTTRSNYQENWYEDSSDLLAMIKTQEVLYQQNKDQIFKVTTHAASRESSNSNKQFNMVNMGFQTASAKPIHISKEAEIKALEIFKNLPELEAVNEKRSNTSPKKRLNDIKCGFQTASAKPIHISKEAEMKAFEMCKNLPELDPIENVSSQQISNVANNRNCDRNPRISENNDSAKPKDEKNLFTENHQPSTSKAAAKMVLLQSNIKENNEIKVDQDKEIKDYWENEADLADVIFSEWPLEELLQGKSLATKNTKEKCPPLEDQNNAGCFQTARGKKISVSTKAQSAVAQLLKEFSNGTDQSSPEQDLLNLKNKILTKNHKLTASNQQECNIKPNTNLHGFQTAGGKSIQISKKAESSVVNLLQEFQADFNSNNLVQNLVEMKSKLQSKRKDLIKTNTKENNASAEINEGFQTAGGKKLIISEKAKNSVANLLLEFQCKNDINSCEQDLAELKEKIHHKKNQLKTKDNISTNEDTNLHGDKEKCKIEHTNTEMNSNSVSKPNVLNGFQTAGGKNLQISYKARKAVENILKEFQNDVNTDYEANLKEAKLKMQAKNNQLKSIKERHIEDLPNINDTLPKTSNHNVNTPGTLCNQPAMQHILESPLNALPTKSVISDNNDNSFRENNSAEIIIPSTSKRRLDNVNTPLPPSKRIQQSFSELSVQSPLNTSATKSIISRKNLLSLRKKPKQRKHSYGISKNSNNFNEDLEGGRDIPSNSIEVQQDKTPLKAKSMCHLNSPWTPNVNDFFKNAPNCSTPRTKDSDSEIQEDFKSIAWEEKSASFSKTTKLVEECGSNITLNSPNPSANDRIGRLKMYGEAPPITPISIDIPNNCRPSGLRRTRRKITKTNSVNK